MALLLANLLFLAWHYWIKVDPLPVVDSYQGVARLELAKRPAVAPESGGEDAGQAHQQQSGNRAVELQSQSLVDEAEEIPEEPVTAVPVLTCVSLGPFPELEDAEAALARLSNQGYQASQRSSEGEIWQGYWVYLPPFSNREAARGALNMLGSKGINDAYIIPGGEDKNAISLGLYSEKERAERRIRDVRAKGVEPRMAESKRLGTVYWLDVQVPDTQAIDPLEYRSSSDKILRLRAEPCEGEPVQAAGED